MHVKAHIHAGWNAGGDIEARMRRIAANPPIRQSGKEVHVGEVAQEDRALYNNITIDYEISAPKSVALNLHSGSGDVEVDNLGRYLKAQTGSGSVRAHGIAGAAELATGSGDIELQQSAQGEVKAQTGSGSIRINGLDGALTARTGSGDIEANGLLSGPSKLQTGSGSIRAHIGRDSHLTVDATSGSGTIRVSGLPNAERHHLSGPINGGGPQLEGAHRLRRHRDQLRIALRQCETMGRVWGSPCSAPPKLLVFDLDGTLIDSRIDLTNSVNATLEHFGKPALADATVASYIGDGVAALVRRVTRPRTRDRRKSGSARRCLRRRSGRVVHRLLLRAQAGLYLRLPGRDGVTRDDPQAPSQVAHGGADQQAGASVAGDMRTSWPQPILLRELRRQLFRDQEARPVRTAAVDRGSVQTRR